MQRFLGQWQQRYSLFTDLEFNLDLFVAYRADTNWVGQITNIYDWNDVEVLWYNDNSKNTVRLRDIVPLNPNEFVNERVAWRDDRNIVGRITSVKKSTGRKGTKRTQSVLPVLGSVENILGTSNPDSAEAELSAEDSAVVSTADNAGTPCTPRVRQRVVTVNGLCVDVYAIRWMDNRYVHLLSTFCASLPVAELNRFDRKRRQYIRLQHLLQFWRTTTIWVT